MNYKLPESNTIIIIHVVIMHVRVTNNLLRRNFTIVQISIHCTYRNSNPPPKKKDDKEMDTHILMLTEQEDALKIHGEER